MPHLAHDAGLQADKITREYEVDHLPAAVLGGFVTQAHAAQSGEKLGAVAALHQDRRAGFNGQFADLKPFHETDFFLCHLDKGVTFP